MGETMLWATMLVMENKLYSDECYVLVLGEQWWESCQGLIAFSAENRFLNCTVTVCGTHSPICWCQSSESLQKRGQSKKISPHYAPTPINHGYREVTSCHYSLREEVVNRLGSKQVVCSQWYMKLSGDSRRRTALLRDAPDEH